MPTHVAAFVTAIALLAILPGANNATITHQTLTGGRNAGLRTVAGASTGILIWSAAAALGLSAVLLAQPRTYLLLRLTGAAVLCFLGARTLHTLLRSRRNTPSGGGPCPSPPSAGTSVPGHFPGHVSAAVPPPAAPPPDAVVLDDPPRRTAAHPSPPDKPPRRTPTNRSSPDQADPGSPPRRTADCLSPPDQADPGNPPHRTPTNPSSSGAGRSDSSSRGLGSGPTAAGETASGGRRDFAAGVATSLGNPKAGVVAVSLIPQFVTADGPVLLSSMALGVIWAAVSGAWFCLYVWTVDSARSRWERPATQRLLQAATGLTLVGLGVAVAFGT
jgi:threonine/homoserine/homoserine lactone efflux protein